MSDALVLSLDGTADAVLSEVAYHRYAPDSEQLPSLLFAKTIIVDLRSTLALSDSLLDEIAKAQGEGSTVVWVIDHASAAVLPPRLSERALALRVPVTEGDIVHSNAISPALSDALLSGRVVTKVENGWRALLTMAARRGYGAGMYIAERDRREFVVPAGCRLETLMPLLRDLLSAPVVDFARPAAARRLLAAAVAIALTLTAVRYWQRANSLANSSTYASELVHLVINRNTPVLNALEESGPAVLDQLAGISESTGGTSQQLALAATLMLEGRESRLWEQAQRDEAEAARAADAYSWPLHQSFLYAVSRRRMEAARYRATRRAQIATEHAMGSNSEQRFLALGAEVYPFGDCSAGTLLDSLFRSDGDSIDEEYCWPESAEVHDDPALRELHAYWELDDAGGRWTSEDAVRWAAGATDPRFSREVRALVEFNALVAMANSGSPFELYPPRPDRDSTITRVATAFAKEHPESYLADDALVLGVRFGLVAPDAHVPLDLLRRRYRNRDMFVAVDAWRERHPGVIDDCLGEGPLSRGRVTQCVDQLETIWATSGS